MSESSPRPTTAPPATGTAALDDGLPEDPSAHQAAHGGWRRGVAGLGFGLGFGLLARLVLGRER